MLATWLAATSGARAMISSTSVRSESRSFDATLWYPDDLPVIGYVDDAAVFAGAVKLVAAHIKPEHRAAAQRALARMREAA